MKTEINRNGSRSETTSTETNPLRQLAIVDEQLPIVDEESGPHAVQKDVSSLGTVRIAPKSKFFCYDV